MDFLFDAQTWGIIAVVIGVIAIFFGLRFARTKGVDTDQLAKDVAQAINYGKIIASLVKAKDETRSKIFTVLEVADIATELAVKTNIATTREEEKKIAKDAIDSVLAELHMTVTPEQRALIEAAIDAGIDHGTERNTIKVVDTKKLN